MEFFSTAQLTNTGDNGKYPYVNGYEVWRREGNAVGSPILEI